MSKGLFCVIDGGDGSGKATQTKLLAEKMSQHCPPVLTLSFPRYETATGRLVKQYLKGTFGDPTKIDARFASALYAADRLAAAPEIAAALESGKHVIADRYVAANMGHQGSKIANRHERTSLFLWLDQYEHGENGIPRPDLNVILHVPAAVSMSLIEKRGNARDKHETFEHLEAAEQTYLEIASSFPNFHLIECFREGRLLSPDEIHAEVWDVVRQALATQRGRVAEAVR